MRIKRNNKIFWIKFSAAIIAVAAIAAGSLFLDSIYRMPVLTYHSIDYTTDRSDRLVVSPEIFEKQMKYLRDNGYKVVGLEKAVEYTKSGKRPPKKTVAITIDDGYENNYKYAYPVLKKYHIPATIFVIVNFVGKDGFLDWAQIKEMSDSRVIDIESHTMSHPWLTGCDDSALRYELVESRKILGNNIGKKIKFLCYPMGGYDERVKAAARSAGYEAAFATKPKDLRQSRDLYEIKRIRISSTANNLFVFFIKVSGYHSFFKVVKDDGGKERDKLKVLWKKGSLS